MAQRDPARDALQVDAESLERHERWDVVEFAAARGRLAPWRYDHYWMAWQAALRGRRLGEVRSDFAGLGLELWPLQFLRLEGWDGTVPEPKPDGGCPRGDEAAFRAMRNVFRLSHPAPIAPPLRRRQFVEKGRLRWACRSQVQAPEQARPRVTVTLDLRHSDDAIRDAVSALRELLHVAVVRRPAGPPFWHRYGPVRTVELYDAVAVRKDTTIRAWAAEECERRAGTRSGAERERKKASAVLGAMRRLVAGDLGLVFRM